jgi:PBP1b-binding outer membrane lipoprotein LpoB
MKRLIGLALIGLVLAGCENRGSPTGWEMDTIRSGVERDTDTIVNKITDAVDSTTEAILDSARSKGPKIIKKGKEAVKEAVEDVKN